MATINNSVFLTALEARQNPIRERAVHDEVRGIESVILDSVKLGLYEATVDNGTPMTNSVSLINEVWTINPATDELFIPSHPFSTGDTVTVTSTLALPAPLKSASYYYVIYVDSNHIKLADSYANAVSNRPISIDVTAGLTTVQLTNQGSGYIQPPVVTFSGGNPTTPAVARAYLASYGSILSIANSTNGAGYTDIPTVQILPQGSAAVAGTVSYQVVGISISNSGIDYHVNDVITVSGGTGVSATALITSVNSNGNILSISLSNTGNYTVLPTLSGAATTVMPGGGSGATVNLTMGIKSVAISAGGTGYTAPPRIRINDPSGVNAVAVATLTGGSVTGITILDPGYSYVGVSSVVFDSGSSASAIASLQSTGVQSAVVNNGGNGYTNIPAVTIVPFGSGATAGTISMKVVSAVLINPGIGYSVDDYLLISGGVASQNAVIRVTSIDKDGKILTYSLNNSGVYTALPGLTSNPVNGGTGTLAAFDLTMGVNSIAVGAGGSNYQVPPLVAIAAPGGSGIPATAIANLTNNSVTSYSILNPGSGYTSVPVVTVSNGSGATAQASLTPTSLVNSTTMTNFGSGYTFADVTFVGGGASVPATGTANIVAGIVDYITVITGGVGYTSLPEIVINGDGSSASAVANALAPTSIQSVSILQNGSGYNYPPNVSISGSASVSSVMQGTGIDRLIVTNSGNNYVSTPTVLLIPGVNQTTTPISPVLTAQRGFSVSNIAILSSGENYQSAPSVTIAPPQQLNGIQATANASIGAGAGTFGIKAYPTSRDYYKAWKSQPLSNEQLSRPYIERMDTVVNYFTNLGYTINRITNSTTNATITWKIQW